MELPEQLRQLVKPWPDALRAELDEIGDLLVTQKRNMFHLDADALNDRLLVWSRKEVHATLPHANAYVSFRHARPADPDEDATLDLQEAWHDLEPTLRLEAPRAEDLPSFARLVPRFVAIIDAQGRPLGYRSPDEGNVE